MISGCVLDFFAGLFVDITNLAAISINVEDEINLIVFRKSLFVANDFYSTRMAVNIDCRKYD